MDSSKRFKVTIALDESASVPSKGLHRARCISAEVKENKAKDGDNLVLDFEILTPAEKGRRVTLFQSLKESVAWRYTQVFAAFGLRGASVTITNSDFVGKTVKLQISHGDYNGDTRANIDRVLPDGDKATAKASSAKAAQDEPLAGDEDDDDEPAAPVVRKAKKPAPVEEPDVEDEDDEEEAPAPKKAKKPAPAPVEDDEDDEDDEDEETTLKGKLPF